MLRFVLTRLGASVPTLLAVVLLSFTIVRLSPGSPFSSERALAPGVKETLEARYGLSLPLPQQLQRYVGGLLHGDLGPSIKYPEHQVADIIAEAMPHTALLAACALLWGLLLGGALGLVTALYPQRRLGRIADTCTAMLLCLPSFVLGPLLVLAATGANSVLPPAGWGRPVHVVLPAATLGTVLAGSIARLFASGMSDALRADFIRTARAKGLWGPVIFFRHALWAGIGPLISYLGPASASLLVGSVAVERIFCVPGLGPFFVDAAQNRDYFLVMGIVLVEAILLLLLNLLVDIINAWVDPRIRLHV